MKILQASDIYFNEPFGMLLKNCDIQETIKELKKI